MVDYDEVTPDQLAPDLGERIAKALKVRGWSVQALAQYLEVHRNTVGAWISGRQEPHPAMIKLIAIVLDVPLQWLRTGNFPDTPDEDLTQVSQDG